MIVCLKEKTPLRYKDVFTWYNVGEEFEVVETKNIQGKSFYVLKNVKWNIILDGFTTTDIFEEVKK